MTLEGNVAEPIRNAAIDPRGPECARGAVPVIRRSANRIDFPVVRHVTAQYFSHRGADRHRLRVTRARRRRRPNPVGPVWSSSPGIRRVDLKPIALQ